VALGEREGTAARELRGSRVAGSAAFAAEALQHADLAGATTRMSRPPRRDGVSHR
jgi:hypothetical protein